MGTWDTTSFGNDTANDWAYDLENCNDTSYIETTLQKVLDTGDDYLEAPDAEEGIAAAEVLAWLRGNPSKVDAFTEKIARWVANHSLSLSTTLVQKALSVIDRVQQEPSELIEVWKDDPDWVTSLADLRARLTR